MADRMKPRFKYVGSSVSHPDLYRMCWNCWQLSDAPRLPRKPKGMAGHTYSGVWIIGFHYYVASREGLIWSAPA